MNRLPLAETEEQQQLWKRLQPVNRVAASDTYKRNMSCSSEIFSDRLAVYTLAARKALDEENVNGRFIMAGLEKMLYPWFSEPITQTEVEKARDFFTSKGAVAKFPQSAWEAVLGNGGRMPLDIYALPGGQTFLAKDGKHVPIMSVEGRGALASHLEPHLEGIYAPIIQATKARLMKEQTGQQFAEFGLRSNESENNHVTLMLALYVGGKFTLTSDDQAVMLFPNYFKDIGTIGHEFMMAYQREGVSLEEAQEKAFRDFVAANTFSALLPDVISTLHSGLPAILRLVQEYRGTGKIIIPRFDSGNVPAQCSAWEKTLSEAGILGTKKVVEDGYNPTKVRETKQKYALEGFNSEDIIVGSGGYFLEGCTRDAISLVYKRSATEHGGRLEASLKFSDSPGKESIPGRIRIYDHNNTLIVAQYGEEVEGKPLMIKVLDQGRITYTEDLHQQAARAEQTWNSYDTIEYSPLTKRLIKERIQERDIILAKYKG